MNALLVNIDVDDIEKGIAFYCAALGVKVSRRFGNDFAELVGASSPIYLLLKPAGSPASESAGPTRAYTRHWTPVHFDLGVDDAAAAVARACAAGARLERGISEHAYGRLAVMADPFGHGFCFVEFNGRGYDALMTDLSSIAPAGGTP